MRKLVVLLAVLAVVGGVLAVGAPGTATSTTETDANPALAQLETTGVQSTDGTLEAAVDDTETFSFTFTPDSDGEITAGDNLEADGVELTFDEWVNTDTGEDGGSPSWPGQGGDTYEVTYEAEAPAANNPPAGDRSFSPTVEYEGGSASESFTVTVVGPEFGGEASQSDSVTLRGDQGFETTDTVSLTVDNDGDGVLVPDSVSFDGVPDNVELETSLPDEIAAEDSGTVSIDATVDHSEDDFTMTAAVSDNLENEQEYEIDVTVETPPVVEIAGDPFIENATAGDSVETEVRVEEASGFEGVDAIEFAVDSDDTDVAALDLSELDDISLEPSEVVRENVTLSIDEDAEQYRELSFTITASPADSTPTVETETEFRSEVLFAGQFSSVELVNDTVLYDEPRDEIDVINDTITVDLENAGDFPLNVTDENVTIDSDELTVTHVGVNETIAEETTETAEVAVEGDPDAFEQVVPLEFELSGETHRGDPADPALLSESIAIEHARELVVEPSAIELGQVQVGTSEQTTVVFEERLGYQDIENVTIGQLAGPESDWLEFSDGPPDTVPAGEPVEVPIVVTFDLDAELLTTYEWAFLTTGEDVEDHEFTVTGTPQPVNVDPLREDLTAFDTDGPSGPIATEMIAIIDDVEAGIEDGTVPRSDIGTTLSAGRSVVLLLTHLEDAETELEQAGPDATQESIVRSATAYNTFVLFADEFEDADLAASAGEIEELASERVDAVVEAQITQLEAQLDDDSTLLEQAAINRQLAQLAALRGNTDRAATLEQDADEAFEAYTAGIEAGEDSFQEARAARNRISDDHAVDVFGQPVLVNPVRYGEFLDDQSVALSAYDDAVDQFSEAGATERANTVAGERNRAETELAVTQRSLFVSLALYLLVAVVLTIYLTTAVRSFRLDQRAVEPDEFFE